MHKKKKKQINARLFSLETIFIVSRRKLQNKYSEEHNGINNDEIWTLQKKIAQQSTIDFVSKFYLSILTVVSLFFSKDDCNRKL